MPGDRHGTGPRRRLVPAAASRSLWLSAVWTGAGTALVCAVVAIAGVAICWLPAAGRRRQRDSAIRAGVLTFLAALHGGITVDGVDAAFVPLGMTVVVGGVRLAGRARARPTPPTRWASATRPAGLGRHRAGRGFACGLRRWPRRSPRWAPAARRSLGAAVAGDRPVRRQRRRRLRPVQRAGARS